RVPRPGMIGVFDRSHYEDVLIGKVRSLADPAEIERRYDAINAFEAELAEAGRATLTYFEVLTILAFAIFQIVGAGILDTAAWMFALGAMTFSGVFVASYLGYAAAGKRTRVDAAA
ncbi:hypothetical protein KCW65_21700, partial [Mycobacterium tuberculosis]|nr:hypothetical protein [Mycobacterium tuberculosis]